MNKAKFNKKNFVKNCLRQYKERVEGFDFSEEDALIDLLEDIYNEMKMLRDHTIKSDAKVQKVYDILFKQK